MNRYLETIMRFFTKDSKEQSDNTQASYTHSQADEDFLSKLNPPKERHTMAKFVAVFIAAGLWLYVMNEQNPPIEARYTVPLEIRNVQTNYVVVDNPGEVRLRIRGPRGLIAGTSGKDMRAYVDMTNLSEGSHSIGVHSIIPAPLELIENAPETVTVRLEPIIARTIPVTIDFNGVLPKGFIIGKVTAKLSEAVVKGPKHIVDAVERLAGKVDITGKTASFYIDAPLVPLGRAGVLAEGLSVMPQVTQVQVVIEPDFVKKTLEVRPIFDGKLPAGVSLMGVAFDPPGVEVREPSTASGGLDKLEYIYTEPIKLDGIGDNVSRKLRVNLPDGMTAEQNTVTANIQVSKN